MAHPRRAEWEERLKKVFDEIDDYLEDSYGDLYRLHPARPERDLTSNKAQDGLFNVGATFTPGYGSEYGRGYVVEIRLVTLERVADAVFERVEGEVIHLLRESLPQYFPQKELYVKKDGSAIKIYGDLSFS